MKRLALALLVAACSNSESTSSQQSDTATAASDTATAASDTVQGAPDDSGGLGGDATADGSDATGVDGDASGAGEDAQVPVECPVSGGRPQAISEHVATYDAAKHRIVLVGGNPEFPVQCIGKNAYTAETWAYYLDCGVWTKLPEGPSARGRSGGAFVSDENAFYVWGGRFREKGANSTSSYELLTDLWRLDLTTDTWSEVAVKGTVPAGRHSGTMTFDAAHKRLLLFGGSSNPSGATFTPLNTTHAFDLETKTWSLLSTKSNPPARLYPAGAIDTDRNLLVIMQGGDEFAFTGPFLGDVWGLNLDTLVWGRLHEGGKLAPDSRIWSTIAYVPEMKKHVMFGGHDDGTLGNRNDLWVFDPADQSWLAMQLNDALNHAPAAGTFCDFPADFTTITEGTPERRGAHVLVYAPDRHALYVHGGKTDCGLIDDLWELNLKTWTWTDLEPASIGESCLRFSDTCKSHCN